LNTVLSERGWSGLDKRMSSKEQLAAFFKAELDRRLGVDAGGTCAG
jgi:hypothetical protein